MIIGQLPTPLPYINDTMTQVAWRVTYPDNILYYELQNVHGLMLSRGNWDVPQSIMNTWGPDDSVMTDALIEAAPWVIVEPTTTTTTSTIIIE